MENVIAEIIQRVPYLLWPIIIFLSFFGLVVLLTKVYDFLFKRKKGLIDELKEHLEFKGQRVNEYKNYVDELKEQLESQTNIAEINYSIAEQNYNIALNIDAEKNELKQKYAYAILTYNWMFEREIFIRKLLFTTLSRSDIPNNLAVLLDKHFDYIRYLVESNELLHSSINSQQCETLHEKIAEGLSQAYLNLPIKEDIDIFDTITSDITNTLGTNSSDNFGEQAKKNEISI